MGKVEIVTGALRAVEGDKRWGNAIMRAAEPFLADAPAEMQGAFERALMYSATSSQCQCEAGKHDLPCKHKALIRLLELQAASEAEVVA